MGTMSVNSQQIKRLEKEFGKYIDHFQGWIFFEGGIVSYNENIYLKTKKAVDSILSHHSNKYDEESRDSSTLMQENE